MTIPVRNIYYLLLYAWGYFRSDYARNVGADESPDLPNLLGKVLNDGANNLLRRGLDRGYLSTTTETRSPKGKLRVDVMTKRQTLLRGFAVCDQDELKTDLLHNQIIKASLVALANCSDVDRNLRVELHKSAKRMHQVSLIRLTSDLFHRVQLSRNTYHYSILLRICELCFRSLMPDERGDNTKFLNILEDEIYMPGVFEAFLRNFYKLELPEFTVKKEQLKWRAEAEDENDLQYLPRMETDISLKSNSRIIIIDAKYYKTALETNRGGGPKIQGAHLFQLSSYLANAQPNPNQKVSGFLIYPTNGQEHFLNYRLLGKQVTVATIDLSLSWRSIQEKLMDLIRVSYPCP